jgi:transcriptional regulator GlxA family with amidase domain
MTYFSLHPADRVPKRIGILGFNGVANLDLVGPLEVFAKARSQDEQIRRHPLYEVVLTALEGRSFISEAGLTFRVARSIENAPTFDTIIVPGGLRNPIVVRKISAWLRARAVETRRIASVSTGLYLLAESGLVDNRQVATHWRCSHAIAKQFPKLKVNHTATFLKDGPFYTCGGGAAGIEMSLALVHEDYGVQVARSLARELVMNLRPPGEDDRILKSPQFQPTSIERLADLPAWMCAHLHENLSVDSLAEKAGLSRRQFSRLFKSTFDSTPADFLEELRLSEARRRLLMPRTSVESVAAAVGFNSADAFRRAFQRRLGITPRGFRSRFQLRPRDFRSERESHHLTLARQENV